MLRSIHVFAATLLLSVSAQAATIGQPAPAFTGTDALTGKTVSLESLKGKPVVLEWNNFGCPFVQKHYGSGNMQKQQAAAMADGVSWVVVNSSAEGKQGAFKDGAEVKAALTEHKSTPSAYILDHDGKIGRAYEAKVTPHMFVIDKTGTLVYQGAIDSNPSADAADIKDATPYVSDALAALKAGTPIKTTQSKAYGCGVKYSY